MSRVHGPRSLRARLFVGIAATLAVSTIVMLAVGAALTRRSLDDDARRSLARQVDLIAAQHAATPLPRGDATIGRFLATEQERLAILTPQQAELLLPDTAASHPSFGRDAQTAPWTFAVSRSCTPRDSVAATRSCFCARLATSPPTGSRSSSASRSQRSSAPSSRRLSHFCSRAPSPGPVTRVAAASRRLAEGESPDPLPVEGSTELRQLSTAFNELSEELHRAQDAERAFLLSVSHELKTPLTAIRGHAEGLADGVVAPERAGEVIEREAHRLERLIRDLLDLARLRRRSFDVTLVPGRPR